MKNKKLFAEFLQYVVLNIAGMIAYSCYTIADTFFISADLGANGLTALNLAFPFFCLINGAGLMIGTEGSPQYAIQRSRAEENQAHRFFTEAVFLTFVFSLLFVLLGLFFPNHWSGC